MREATAVLAGAVTDGARDVARLVLPVECPGCGRWDVPLCAACAGVLDGAVRRCERDVPRLDRMDGRDPMPVWTAAAYAGPVRGVVVGWKDRGRADLTARLVAAARRAGREIGPLLREAIGPAVVRLVPVPSSPGARRRRGADQVRLLADGAAHGLRAAGVTAEVAPVLARRRGGRDQVGLGARARGRNAAGSVRLRRPVGAARGTLRGGAADPGPAGRLHLLVDDVVTTGSTLAACERVLSDSGGLVLGALVLAATPPPARPPARLLRTAPGD